MEDDVHYLNCAYMSPLLKRVEESAIKELIRRRNPFELGLDDFFGPMERVKSLFAKLINTSEKDRIAIIPSVSYGLANAANNIVPKKGGNVVILEGQFPSNYYIWKKKCNEFNLELRIIARSEAKDWSIKVLDSIDSNTVAVAVAQVHWADGMLFDLKSIGTRCKEHNALFVVDGTQSVGAFPFDVQEIQVDALICASYKWMMGPYGMGLAYYGSHFDAGSPIEENWLPKKHSDQFAGLTEYQEAHRPLAWKYSVGECSNFIYLKMLIASLEQILDWDVNQIQAYCHSISEKSIKKLIGLGCQIADGEDRAAHLFGILPPENCDIQKLWALFKQKKVFVSQRGAYIRVSPNVYNTEDNMEALTFCFENSLSQKS